MAQGWLIIERVENRDVDAVNGFSFFGLSERYRKTAAEISNGDFLYCYVSSGLSAFADIRTVRNSSLKAMKKQAYHDSFSYYFETAPYIVLPRTKWVPLKSIASKLDLTKDRREFRSLFRTSIKKLTSHDAAFLAEMLRKASGDN